MRHNDITRRQIIRGLLGVGGLTAAGAAGLDPLLRLALADDGSKSCAYCEGIRELCPTCVGASIDAKDHFFVFVYFSGAWDLMLSLDPRDESGFYNEGNVATSLTQPGYKLLDEPSNDGQLYEVIRANGLPDILGPFMGELMDHFDKLAIVRGMSAETLTHEAGRRRFLTGKPPSGLAARGSSAATWLASQLGGAQLVPNLAMRVETYNVDQPNFASGLKVSSVKDLVRVLQASGPAMNPKVATHLDAMLSQSSVCPVAMKAPLFQDAESARLKAREMVLGGLDQLFDFKKSGDFNEMIRGHFGMSTSTASTTTSVEARAAAAALAITEGVARVVSFQANDTTLDTHYDEWTTDQGPTQERGFNAVARLIKYLECTEYKNTGACWLDHTTIVGFSEFGRSAMLNANSGRDHSLTNGTFLAGAGIRGATIVGESSEIGMMPTKTDLVTGAPSDDPKAKVVKPEHILQTLFHLMGQTSDPADLRVSPLQAIMKP